MRVHSYLVLHIHRKSFWLLVLSIVSICFLALYFLFTLLVALNHAYSVDTYATDGTFQLYNPLRRLALGQVAGYDFPFFHGIGVVLLHFPIFYIFGEHVFAAEFAKWFVSPLLFFISTLVFFYAFFKDIQKTLVATALFTILAIFAIDVIWPGNSLIGTRSTFPVLVAASLLWKSKQRLIIKGHSIHWSSALTFILLGLSFACGTEQGLSAIVAYIVLQIIIALKHPPTTIRTVLRIGSYCLIIAISILLVMTLFTLGHPLGALHYALIDIPSDQGWYFGAPPNNYLTWSNLLPGLMDSRLRFVYLDTVITVIAVLAASKLGFIDYHRKQVFAFMLLSGIIVFIIGATGGYYAPNGQLVPFHRLVGLAGVASLVSLIFGNKAWSNRKLKLINLHIPNKLWLMIPITTITIIGILLCTYTQRYFVFDRSFPVTSYLRGIRNARHASDYTMSSPDWKTRLDTFKPYIKPGSTIWSTYTSLYDSTNGTLNPSQGGEDYIIHALGNQRRQQYQNNFITDKPANVITVKPTYFYFEEWLWSRDWTFYKHLLTNYSLVAENQSHFLWQPQKRPIKNTLPYEPLIMSDNSYILPDNPTNQIRVYDVSISYKANANMLLSPFNKVPRYLIDINHASAMQYPISLPPDSTNWAFPIILMPGEKSVTLKAKTDGLIPFATLSIKDISYKELPISKQNTFLFMNNYCSFGTHYPRDPRCSETNLQLKKYEN